MRKLMHRTVLKIDPLLTKSWHIYAVKKALERANTKEAKFVDHADVIRWLKTW